MRTPSILSHQHCSGPQKEPERCQGSPEAVERGPNVVVENGRIDVKLANEGRILAEGEGLMTIKQEEGKA